MPRTPAAPRVNAFRCDTDTASEALACLIDGLRATGTQLHGTNAQIAFLIRDALDMVNPDAAKAMADRETLYHDFDVMAEALLINEQDDDEDASADYPDDEPEDEEE